MEQILSLTVLVEPDRQRFARFAIEAARALDGNPFSLAPKLVAFLNDMRREAAGSVTVRLEVEQDRLLAGYTESPTLLCRLPRRPPEAVLEGLTEQLRRESETADPELLRRRNQAVQAELEKARERAAAEMAELEAALDRKKEQLRQSMRKAETDALTGLYNRAAYDRRLTESVTRSLRQGEPLCLILLDLDKFKRINDTYGHQYGDDYLRRMAEAIRQAVREGVDHGFRYGGDEFAVLVYADEEVAQRIACAVLRLMNGAVSAGVAQLCAEDSEERLVARADEALYAAKHQGRGRVVVAQAAG